MEQEKIARINALARKAKAEGLTPEEIAERDVLRKEYIADVKGSLVGQLENTTIVRPDGTRQKVQKKKKYSKGHCMDEPAVPLFYGCVYRTYRRNERPMIHSSRIRGMPTVKLLCFVLWRNSCIPAMAPTPPPKKAERNSVRSGIRQRPSSAFRLSMPIRKKASTLMKNR